jgi:membrane-associated phospholipid phosphatase
MFAVLGLAFALRELPFWPGFGYAAAYGLIVSLSPILVILYLLKTGRIAELHMSNTRERHIPYLSAILCTAVAYLLFTLLNAPELLRCLTLFNIIELIALGLINLVFLISIHATGIMAVFVLTGLVYGWTLAVAVVLPFVLLVCYVRLYLKRHTPTQIIAGLALGAFSVILLLPFGCFT